MGRGSSQATVDTFTVRGGTMGMRSGPSGEIVKTKIYRAGSIEKAKDYGPAHQSYVDADSVKPEGHVGRLQGLFCVPTLAEVSKWVHSSALAGAGYNPRPHEFFYHGPEPVVYPVGGWHLALRHAEYGDKEAYRTDYWNLGVPMSDYLERWEELAGTRGNIWSDGGEMLIDKQYVTSWRGVSIQRLVENAMPRYADVGDTFTRWLKRGY